ncbi:MAG: hypothetical protein ABSA96_14825 [Candidatus Acidiferrales bacterium]|jgi:hypothetical protein
MIQNTTSGRGFSKAAIAFILTIFLFATLLAFYGRLMRRFVRESLMQRVTSAHYEILCLPDAMSQETMSQFAMQRESVFMALDRKLGEGDSNAEIKIIFDTDAPIPVETASTPQPYTVSGTTIRTKLDGRTPQLDPAADAEALLQVAWGKRGNAGIGQWTAIWLVGERDGKELGIAAAELEQRIGHQKVETLLNLPPGIRISPQDLAVLGGAWINEIAELGGPAEVRSLYLAKMPKATVAGVTSALQTTPIELERKWQLWIYSYLAGMPAMTHDSDMPMNMPMPGGQ